MYTVSDFTATTNIILIDSNTNKLQSIKLKFQNKAFTDIFFSNISNTKVSEKTSSFWSYKLD